jgi:hypothetical protein
MKIYKLKQVPAPWRGEGETSTVVDMENALKSFPRPNEEVGHIDREGVFIGSKKHNMPTYVLIEADPKGVRYTQWTLGDKKVNLWSINGGGECRWGVAPNGCWNEADKQAIAAYELKA